ncbi:MAG TPA: AmmeMemoRadiSam system protein B [Anaerolineae bacterium]|nr:AmmeMemoRadiSam system protein B [Anaerolineae bacterium]
MLLLRDPLHLSQAQMAIPRQLGPLLALMDGSRDEGALEAALQVRSGLRLAAGLLGRLLADLDGSLLLDNERSEAAKAEAQRAYREAPCRPMTMAGEGYPASGDEATALLQSMMDALPEQPAPEEDGRIRGLVSPHIDYARGGPVYAEVWRAAAEAVRDAELVVLLGTDHFGGEGRLTLTRQSYATPWGVLPTEVGLVDRVAEAIGPEEAFAEELHHRHEHSLELAAVWLHHMRQGKDVGVVPVLCGSFSAFVIGNEDPAAHEPFVRALDILMEAVSSRPSLVVAAADLAHMGPAFGDPIGLDPIGRAQLRGADARLLSSVTSGDAQGFLEQLKAERDRRHVCGLPPIYLALKLLGEVRGESAGYALCPADPEGMSYVSIAGMVLR